MNGNENNPYFSSGAFTTGAEITYSSFLKPNKCAFNTNLGLADVELHRVI